MDKFPFSWTGDPQVFGECGGCIFMSRLRADILKRSNNQVGRRGSPKKAQAVIMYALLLGVIFAALTAMNVYMRRGVQGKVKDISDAVIGVDSSGHIEQISKTDSATKVKQDMDSLETVHKGGGTEKRMRQFVSSERNLTAYEPDERSSGGGGGSSSPGTQFYDAPIYNRGESGGGGSEGSFDDVEALYQSEMGKLQEQIDEINRQIDVINQRVEAIKGEIEDRERQIEAKDRQIAEVNRQIAEVDEQIAALNRDLEILNNQIGALDDQIQNVKNEMDTINYQMSQTTDPARRAELQQLLFDKNDEVNKLRADKEKVEAQRNAVFDQRNIKYGERNQLCAQRDQLEQEKQQLRQEIVDLETEREQLLEKKAQLEEQKKQIEAMIAQLQEQLNNLQTNYGS